MIDCQSNRKPTKERNVEYVVRISNLQNRNENPEGGRVLPKIFDRGVPRRFSNPNVPYLRVKEGKTDTLFKDRTRKMTTYSRDQNNG